MKTFLAKDVGCTNYIGKSVIQQHDVVQVKKTGKKIPCMVEQVITSNHIRVTMLPASLCPLLKTNVMIYTEKKRFNNESRTQPDFFENPTEKQILYQNSSSYQHHHETMRAQLKDQEDLGIFSENMV